MKKFPVLVSLIVSFIFINFISFYINPNKFRIEYSCEKNAYPILIKVYWKYHFGKDSIFNEKNCTVHALGDKGSLILDIPASISNPLENIRLDIESPTGNFTVKSVTANGRPLNPNTLFNAVHNAKITSKNGTMTFVRAGYDPYIVSERLRIYDLSFWSLLFVTGYAAMSFIIYRIFICREYDICSIIVNIWSRHHTPIMVFIIPFCIFFINRNIYEECIASELYTHTELIYRLFYLSFPEMSASVACMALLVSSKGIFRGLLFSIFCIGMIFKILDVFSFVQFSTHMTSEDISVFWKDAFSSLPIFTNFCTKRSGVCLLFLVAYGAASVLYFWNDVNTQEENKRYIFYAAAAVLPVVYFMLPLPKVSLFDEGTAVNIFSSGNDSSRKKYTSNYKYKDSELKVVSINGVNGRQNIIVLFVESLSSESSLFFGSANGTNAMPNLDAIAAESLAFVNHHSNGYNTDTGNYAFLAGRPHLHYGIPYSWEMALPLPRIFGEKGYSTHILYSSENIGDLESIWRNSGFDVFHDGRDSAYAGSERLTFNAVPDANLLDNVRAKIAEFRKPFFAMVMTSTSHSPFIVPHTFEKDYMKTVKYVDKEIGRFFMELRKSGFFDNGLLVITGDHRAMVSLSRLERNKYGELAMARVPLVIYGKGVNTEKITKMTSHIYLHAILQYLALDKTLFYEFNSIQKKDVQRDEKIFYQKHSPRDRVVVADKEGIYVYTLDGDDTETNDKCLNTEDNKKLIYLLRTR